MVKPPDYEPGEKYPDALWIHGGPNMQDDHSTFGLYPLQLERQLFAARVMSSWRSTTAAEAVLERLFTRSIFADWGAKEVDDLLAGADEAVRMGVADPDRLGIGGWSYGGILTNYTIAADGRFKAAVRRSRKLEPNRGCTASTSTRCNTTTSRAAVARPGSLGEGVHPVPCGPTGSTRPPCSWGEKDFNVPISGSEQMYQALRTLGVPTQLVVYPGQYHLLTKPSYIRDRLERTMAWFDAYLKAPQK